MQKFKAAVFPALLICFALLLGAFFLGRRSVNHLVLSTQRPAPAQTDGLRDLPAPTQTAQPCSTAPSSGRVDLNRAGLEELTGLPGIGPARAQKILDYRAAHGPFLQTSDLMKVSGIGEGIFSGLRDLVCVEEQHEDPDH